MGWDDGPDKDEYAGQRGEELAEARRGEDYWGNTGRHARSFPQHYAGLAEVEGWREQW